MALQAIYENQEQIPEAFRELFSERNGKFELTGITGIRTQADVDRVQASLTSERTAHKQTKDRLRGVHFKGKSVVEMNDEELRGAVEGLDRYEELEASAGKMDEGKLAQLVESRIRTKLAPVERERDQLKGQVTELTNQVTGYVQKEKTRTIHDAVRKAAGTAKVIDTAMDDVLMLSERIFDVGEDGSVTARDQVGVTPGVTPDVWLAEMQAKRPHWWPASRGGGARGGAGGGSTFANNPFSAEHWNLTQQGKVVAEQGMEKAQKMAEAAGTTIGGARPAKK